MSGSFRRGVFVGILAPFALLAGAVYWIYQKTQKVPFPVHRPDEEELAFKLVDPEEVPGLWDELSEDLEPIMEQARELGGELGKAAVQSWQAQPGPQGGGRGHHGRGGRRDSITL